MSPEPIPPGVIARYDQVAAELTGIVAAAREHMAGCAAVPAGVCLGEVVVRLADLTCAARFELLQEAVSRLARTPGPPDGGEIT